MTRNTDRQFKLVGKQWIIRRATAAAYKLPTTFLQSCTLVTDLHSEVILFPGLLNVD